MATETQDQPTHHRVPRRWPLYLIGLSAFTAVWAGWTSLGQMAGFGEVHLLPGLADSVKLNTAVTLPLGAEVFGTYAMSAWLSDGVCSNRTRRFAKWSAIAALVLGALGQTGYHLLKAASYDTAPWPVVVVVSCTPVAVLGVAAALAHLIADDARRAQDAVHDTDDAHAQPADRAQPVHDTDRAHDGPVHDADRAQDVAQPVRKASQRVHVDAQRAHDAVPMHSARALPVSANVRTVSLVKAPALCTSSNGVRNGVHSDRWTDAAERLCKADPSGRRDVRTVETILRLHHVDGLPHARIAQHTGCSASTVSRTLTAARAHVESD